jgi:hypothetical protein
VSSTDLRLRVKEHSTAWNVAIEHMAETAGMSPEGWRVFEIWETQEDATAFFAKYIHPNLPPGVTPKRTYLDLYSLMIQPR